MTNRLQISLMTLGLILTLLVLVVALAITATEEADATTAIIEPSREVAFEVDYCSHPDIDCGESGSASWYDYDLNRADQKCRSNDCYSMFNATCASRDYPKGTILTVKNKDNGKTVNCRVNDWVENEKVIIDLSSYAFSQLAPLSVGIINVSIKEQ